VAAPMIGGLLTSAFLTLEVIPVLYTIWRTRQLSAARGGLRPATAAGADAASAASVTIPSNGAPPPRSGLRL
jgi:copper/silver efflux system protein